MRHLRTFGKFWYDFIIGDDWRVALGVTAAIAVLFVVAHDGLNWWWALPAGVAALLAVSLDRATPRRPT
jgi:apolipoprotein N-acyltransferase